MPDLFTIPAAAARLSVHPETLRRAIRAGTLSCYRIGGCIRISDDQLTAYLDSALCPARAPTDHGLSDTEASGPSPSGTGIDVAGFQQARRTNAALDNPSRISKPRLSVIPTA